MRLYPYDISEDGDGVEEKSLRGSSQEIADILKEEIQKKVEIAGLEISKRGLPIWLTRRKSPPPCYSGSRQAPLSMRAS